MPRPAPTPTRPLLTVVPGCNPVRLTSGVLLVNTSTVQLTVHPASTTVKLYCTRGSKASNTSTKMSQQSGAALGVGWLIACRL